ncbi:MAG: hypothetical protein CL582_17890 [Alteromonadaceae bacterium]|nr:hypothetical protein [Alteromonadaceae bacterium]
MLEQPQNEQFDFDSMNQRFSYISKYDDKIKEVLSDLDRIKKRDDDGVVKMCTDIRKELENKYMQWKLRERIDKAHRTLLYEQKKVNNSREFVTSLIADLEEYSSSWSKNQQDYILNMATMSDPKSLSALMERAKEDADGDIGTASGFKTGWHAMNRMLGESGTLRRGMFVLVGGLTHNYKSGLTHDLFRQMCIHNKPILDDPNKKAIKLYISTENEAEKDLLRMYIALIENDTGEEVDISKVNPEEASRYVSKRLSETGFEVAMMRIDPTTFTSDDLFNMVLRYEENGFEVQSITCDYLALINKSNFQQRGGMTGEDVRQLMQNVRNFMSARRILFITPHQLSQESMNLKRSGVGNFLQEVAGKNYWDGSKRIANEADLEIFVDIVERNKKFYLHVHRGKHRTVRPTPIKDRSFYLPFSEIGFLPDDINGEDRSLGSLMDIQGEQIDFDD